MLWISFYFAARLFDEVLTLNSKTPDRIKEASHAVEEKHWSLSRRTLWPGGAVIYTIEPDIGCPFSAACKVIMDALKHYEKLTCIRFKNRSGERDYVNVSYDPERGGCEATLGRRGGEQALILGTECWSSKDVVHEFGHSLGLPDEVTRPDRDDYLEMDFNQIREEHQRSFKKSQPLFKSVMEEPFDYFSIMLYDPYIASKGKETMVSKTNQPVVLSRSKKGLSKGDIKKISRLYECQGNLQDPQFPFDVTCSFDNDVCGFRNLDDAQWLRTDKDDSHEPTRKGYIYVDFGTVEYSAARFASINFHGLSPRDNTRGPKGCVSFSYKISTSGRAALRLSLMRLGSPHQLFYRSPPSSLWAESNAANKWTRVSIPVPVKKPFALVFRAQFKTKTSKGTIGVDDLLLTYSPCTTPTSPRSSPKFASFRQKNIREPFSRFLFLKKLLKADSIQKLRMYNFLNSKLRRTQKGWTKVKKKII